MRHLQHDITTQLQSDDEDEQEDEQEDAQEMQEIYTLLAPLISQLFPRTTVDESTYLYHPDLSANNILVNDQGNLTGIVDWECVMAAPSRLSC
jgi:aminoglycoside phosphotransferase (APT) family kinase protein